MNVSQMSSYITGVTASLAHKDGSLQEEAAKRELMFWQVYQMFKHAMTER